MAKIDPNELCPCDSGLLFKECHGPKVKEPVVPKITEEIELLVIPEPDPNTRAVFIYDGPGTIGFTGFEVGLALCCGKCRSHLTEGIAKNNLRNMVIKCKQCGSYNDTGA